MNFLLILEEGVRTAFDMQSLYIQHNSVRWHVVYTTVTLVSKGNLSCINMGITVQQSKVVIAYITLSKTLLGVVSCSQRQVVIE